MRPSSAGFSPIIEFESLTDLNLLPQEWGCFKSSALEWQQTEGALQRVAREEHAFDDVIMSVLAFLLGKDLPIGKGKCLTKIMVSLRGCDSNDDELMMFTCSIESLLMFALIFIFKFPCV